MTTPINTSLQAPNRYQVTFNRVPNTSYFCQNLNIPGVSLGEIIRNTPFVDLYSPGEKLIYDSFNITFLLDEDLKAWLDIHDWMRALTFPEDFKEYRDLPRLSKFSNKPNPQFSDATVTILTSKYNANYSVKLFDCFPVSLSSIMFNSSDSAESTITADATFRFAYFNIDKL